MQQYIIDMQNFLYGQQHNQTRYLRVVNNSSFETNIHISLNALKHMQNTANELILWQL